LFETCVDIKFVDDDDDDEIMIVTARAEGYTLAPHIHTIPFVLLHPWTSVLTLLTVSGSG